MKKVITYKLQTVRAEMKKIEYTNLYWLSKEWSVLLTKETLLMELLSNYN